MAPRSSWKGYLRLSLVAVPVQAINAAASTDGGDIHFHQLHAPCHRRIRYQKICPEHGEVSNDEIVRGYEYAKGEYVIVEESEIDELRGPSDRGIHLDTFVTPGAIDPAYFDGRTYYLVPDGAMAQKPYAVLLEALKQEACWGVGQAIMFGREQLVAVRPLEHVLGLELLHYASEVRSEATLVDEFPLPDVGREELRLAKKLVEASTGGTFDLAAYHDRYVEKMKQLIDAKVQGKEVVGVPPESETPVINLMDALRKSVAKAGRGQKAPKRAASRPKPARRGKGSRRTA